MIHPSPSSFQPCEPLNSKSLSALEPPVVGEGRTEAQGPRPGHPRKTRDTSSEGQVPPPESGVAPGPEGRGDLGGAGPPHAPGPLPGCETRPPGEGKKKRCGEVRRRGRRALLLWAQAWGNHELAS